MTFRDYSVDLGATRAAVRKFAARLRLRKENSMNDLDKLDRTVSGVAKAADPATSGPMNDLPLRSRAEAAAEKARLVNESRDAAKAHVSAADAALASATRAAPIVPNQSAAGKITPLSSLTDDEVARRVAAGEAPLTGLTPTSEDYARRTDGQLARQELFRRALSKPNLLIQPGVNP